LEKHPWVIWRLFERTHGLGFVISHFSLGDEYEADFVVLRAFSGGWDVHFIELEPPTLSAFNRLGDYSPRMNHAAGQLRKWHLFTLQAETRGYLIHQLARAAKERDVFHADGREPLCSAGLRFDDPIAVHLFQFHIVMGRRSHLGRALTARKAAFPKTDGFEVVSYDRMLEVAWEIHSDPTYEDP
jgi:hypothetical protein